MPSSSRTLRFDYSGLETVIAGANVQSALLSQLERLGARRVFLFTTPSLSQHSGCARALLDALGERSAGMYDGIRAHTPREDVINALTLARKAEADLLLTLGGGSVIDLGKVVQLALTLNLETQEQLVEYAQFADGSRGVRAGEVGLAELVPGIRQWAIPTTLSGAEFSNNAGVIDTAKGLKEGYLAPRLCPQIIFYDPELCLHTPEWLWLSTAIRSLDHAIEGYCSADAHPYLEGQFLHAIKLFAESLPLVKKAPDNLRARHLNQQAVWLACCGLGKVAHGASHGIGYLLGAVCGLPHGITSCVMLPAVLQWNSQENAQRQRPIAEALGSRTDTAAQAVKALVAGLGLPTTLREAGVARNQLAGIAELACRYPVLKRNPRTVNSAKDVMEILRLAW